MAQDSQNQHHPGAPNCPMVHRIVSGALGWPGGELAAFENRRGDVAKNYRTVWWCTGLSNESLASVPKSFSDELVALGKTRKHRG
jgi:hypothetical protein